MRQMSMETMGESAKRKSSKSGNGEEKRMRRSGGNTFEFLNEKLKFDMEWRTRELELRERELEERQKEREAAEEGRRKREMSGERNVERCLEAVHIQLQQQNQLLPQL